MIRTAQLLLRRRSSRGEGEGGKEEASEEEA